MGETGESVTPEEQVRRLYGQAEKQTADAFERLVQRDSFGELLARTTENVMGLTKIGFGVADLVVRNLRVAGKPDMLRLGKQLARNEDKLERVLQEVERLQGQIEQLETKGGGTKGSETKRGGTKGKGSSNGSPSRGSRSTKSSS